MSIGSNVFVADPDALHQAGEALNNESDEFRDNYRQMFETVRQLVENDYVDPAARAIANDIFSYYDQLEYMAGTMGAYGDYCKLAEKKTVDNQSDIISSIKPNNFDSNGGAM